MVARFALWSPGLGTACPDRIGKTRDALTFSRFSSSAGNGATTGVAPTSSVGRHEHPYVGTNLLFSDGLVAVGFDPITVRIDDEGRVVVRAIVGT